MSELEEKLGAVLSSPQLMQQISSLVQAMGQPSPSPSPPPEPPAPDLSQLTSLLQRSRVDSNQQALLHALSPYLSPVKMGKLERAMRASKMAGLASVFLKSGGLNLTGGG